MDQNRNQGQPNQGGQDQGQTNEENPVYHDLNEEQGGEQKDQGMGETGGQTGNQQTGDSSS